MTGKTWLYSVLIVLVLALMGFGIWYVMNPSDTAGNGQAESADTTNIVEMPEEDPVIYMHLSKIMGGTDDKLCIYEDGTVIYIKEWGLRMPLPDNPPIRAWRTGQVSGEELDSLAQLFQTEEFDVMDGYQDFPPQDFVTSENVSGKTMGDMRCDFLIDYAGVQKTLIATHFISPDNGMTYPDMSYPLNEIYQKLRNIGENGTEEVYREEIETDAVYEYPDES